MKTRWGKLLLAAWSGLATGPVAAVDFSAAGFGTVGYARSDQPYTYQRFIDDDGTFRRDSVFGVQFDAKFADEFGGTVQFRLGPASNNDNEYKGTVSWAFLSWRPTNDLLIRVGKQRTPLYLYSQTLDVGVTYDFARLPTEMYSLSPSNDFTGLSFNKSWAGDGGEFILDGYFGKSTTDAVRVWFRDNVPEFGQRSGAIFIEENILAGGLVLSFKQNEDTYRIGVLRGRIKRDDGEPFGETYSFVSLAPGVGYYDVSDIVSPMGHLTGTVVTLGVDAGVGAGFRVISEFARTYIPKTSVSFASTRGYVSLLKRVDGWTPYVVYAFLRSTPRLRDLYTNINYNTVPDFVPLAALINASQRSGADRTFTFDQSSWAVGTSYSFSASSKIKAEYQRTHIGQMSTLVDAPPGSNIRNTNINVFSLSYNFAF